MRERVARWTSALFFVFLVSVGWSSPSEAVTAPPSGSVSLSLSAGSSSDALLRLTPVDPEPSDPAPSSPEPSPSGSPSPSEPPSGSESSEPPSTEPSPTPEPSTAETLTPVECGTTETPCITELGTESQALLLAGFGLLVVLTSIVAVTSMGRD